ncbi:MAG: hypothetical protein ABMA15_03505 [Vicinamibacterales bacterium]
MTTHPTVDPLGLLDRSLDVPDDDGLGPLPGTDGRRTRRWRGLLVWSATSTPVALLLTVGIAFGPQGINLLSRATLTILDPVVPVALAAFGVLVGLSVSDRRTHDSRALGVAGLASAVTMLVVSVGFGVVALSATSSTAQPIWTLILSSGICAATSLTLPSGESLEPRSAAKRVIELGVLLPIVAGGLMLAWLRAGSSAGAGALVAQACGVTLAVAAAAWLLLTRTSSETEERVFAVSALLLVGGVAAALSLSALFGGLVAGVFWRFAGRRPRETITRDVLFVQHPLLVLVLLVAGARADLSPATLALGVGYVVLRVAGQLASGSVVRRAIGVNAPRDLGLHLLPPGVFGVGFALDAVSVVGADASMLLAVVVAGTIGAEFLAVLLPNQRVRD